MPHCSLKVSLSMNLRLLFSTFIRSIGNKSLFEMGPNCDFLHIMLFLRNNEEPHIGLNKISSGECLNTSSMRGFIAKIHCFQKSLCIFLPIFIRSKYPISLSIQSISSSGWISDNVAWKIFAQDEFWLVIRRFSHENLKDSQELYISGALSPPFFSASFASALATLSVPPHMKWYTLSSSVLSCFLLRLGRTIAKWEIFDNSNVFAIHILPYGDRYLYFQLSAVWRLEQEQCWGKNTTYEKKRRR